MCHNQPQPVTPELLRNAIQGEINQISYYEQLSQLTDDSEAVQLLQNIHNDGTLYRNALADLYQQLTGLTPPQAQPTPPQIPSYVEGVKSAILSELEDSAFYRCVALGCNNPSVRLFFDIMADKNRHAATLNYLYTKAVEACCNGEETEPPVCEGITHVVQEGEGLWLIGQRYAVTVEELLVANPQISDPGTIYPGQVLCVPCSGTPYTIQLGDSIWLIAQRHGLTVEQLLAANPFITDSSSVFVDQVLCIPCCAGSESRESLTYLYGGTWQAYLNELAATKSSIRTVSPDFFEINQNGSLLLASSNKLNKEFIDTLHQQDIRVVPFLSNHWNRELGINALANREQLTTQLAAAVEQNNLDGVNFDLENLTEQQRTVYVDLVRLMREKLPSNKTVSVAVAANPNGWTTGWHGSYDYPGLAQYADYLMIMAYDESYQGGPEGPVAGSDFFERSIQYALTQGVPQSKLVVGIPFFGRYWKQGDTTGGIGLAARDVECLLQNYTSTSHYDEATRSAYAVVTIQPGEPEPEIWGGRRMSAGTYHIWYDNLAASHYKLETINRYGLLGAGSWSLGQENPDIWNFYSDTLNG